MRVAKEIVQKNRETVAKTASRLFRKHGYEGIGIAPLMKEAGLTNGAFYKQFDSKEALVLEATEQALVEGREAWKDTLAGADGDLIKTLKIWYLSQDHITRRDLGCSFSALAHEAPRHGADMQTLFAKAIEQHLSLLDSYELMDRDEALRMFCSLVGGLTLARAVGNTQLQADIVNALIQDPVSNQ